MKARALGRLSIAIAAVLSAWMLSAEARAASCSFVSTAGVAFGTYDVFNPSPLDSTGSITFLCNGVGAGDAIVIELSAGGGLNPLNRRMLHGSALLYYNLYLDAARSQVWGNGTGGTSSYGPIVPANGVNRTAIIYGRIPARQNASVGLYADTVIATILF